MNRRIFRKLLLICLLPITLGCSKEYNYQCIYCQDNWKFELMLDYPHTSSGGQNISVNAATSDIPIKNTFVKWYADSYNPPQTLQAIDPLASAGDATYRFKFPELRAGMNYYIHCVITLQNGLTAIEGTAKISSE
jgi:hypothetical protein